MPTYLNHAGTSWPKPAPVRQAAAEALDASALDWPDQFREQHAKVAAWAGAEPSRLLLTPGCTSALAAIIDDLPLNPGERVLCDSFAHQALSRPLARLVRRGIDVVQLPPTRESTVDLDVLEQELALGARWVAVSWATSITGELAPLDAILARAHASKAKVLVDAAQAAGWIPLEVAARKIDVLAFAGHKGPQGPWGIGGLYVAPELAASAAHCVPGAPSGMPAYCDTGSVDRAALAGLAAGIAWLDKRPERLAKARAACARLRRAMAGSDVVFHRPSDAGVPTFAFSHGEWTAPELAARLREHGVIVAGGHMCAPDAHRTLGTQAHGVVRVSVGPTTREEELAHAEQVFGQLL